MSLKNEVDVSVVIPVFNRNWQLKRAIDSVTAQESHYTYEIIVVDDHSENYQEILEMCDLIENLKLIRHTKNCHGGAARNTGIDASQGRYIAFLDSDDAWHPKKLQKCISFLDQSTSVDFVYSMLIKPDRKNRIYPQRPCGSTEKYMDYLLINGGSMQTSTLVVRAPLQKEYKFDPMLKRFQDYDLILKFEKAKLKAGFIAEVLVSQFDDGQENRISKFADPIHAEVWLKKVRNDLSKKAECTFKLTRLAKYYKDSGNFHKAIKILLHYSTIKNSRTWLYLKMLVYILIPNRIFAAIRNIL